MSPPRHSRRRRFRAGFAVCVPLLLLGSAACDTVEQAPAAKPKPQPEDRLEMVLKRLERALTDFRPSGADGLKARSELSSEYVPPGTASEEPRAVITIVTDTLYRGGVGSPTATEEEEDDEPDPDDAGPAGDLEALPVTQKEKTRHELVFRQGAWQLASKPEKSYEEIWFEYALATEVPLEDN